MLEYTAAQFLDDRTDLVSGDADSLWSDDYLIRQFNHAQRILARRAWVIIEIGRAPAGVVVLKTNTALYPLHKSILRVFDATPAGQQAPLGRSEDVNLRDTRLSGFILGDNVFSAWEVGNYASLSGSAATGDPLAIATDAGTRMLRVSPPPSSDYNGVRLALKVARLPINWLSLDDTNAEPEVPEDWHEDLCEYAAGKALTLPMVDGDQKVEGRRLLAAFDAVVREAKLDRLRAEMGPARWRFSSTTAVLGNG